MAGELWKYAVITTKGLLLQGKVAAGGTIEFTKVKTGAGTVEPVLLQAQTDITDKKQEFIFAAESSVNKETGLVSLVVVINNDGLESSYDCYQVGVYATDPDDGEILYAILQSESAMTVPAEAELVGWIAEMNIGMQYGNAETVNITMNQAGAASKEEFYEHANNKENPHGVTAEQVGARPNTWMPTAADVGALTYEHRRVNTYYQLGQFGVTTAVSEITMQEIIEKLPSYSIFITDIGSSWNSAEFPSLYATLEVVKVYGGRISAKLYNVNGKVMYIGAMSGSTWTGWQDVSGDFKSDGSVPMSGKQTIKTSYPTLNLTHTPNDSIAEFTKSTNSASIFVQNISGDATNRRVLTIYDKNGKADVSNALKFIDVDGGNDKDYAVYGEHNITKGTTDIGAGSAMTSLIHIVYEE